MGSGLTAQSERTGTELQSCVRPSSLLSLTHCGRDRCVSSASTFLCHGSPAPAAATVSARGADLLAALSEDRLADIRESVIAYAAANGISSRYSTEHERVWVGEWMVGAHGSYCLAWCSPAARPLCSVVLSPDHVKTTAAADAVTASPMLVHAPLTLLDRSTTGDIQHLAPLHISAPLSQCPSLLPARPRAVAACEGRVLSGGVTSLQGAGAAGWGAGAASLRMPPACCSFSLLSSPLLSPSSSLSRSLPCLPLLPPAWLASSRFQRSPWLSLG